MTFVADDFLFMEKDKSESMMYILQGKVAMLHKQSHTFIKDIEKDCHFGELGFLLGEPRCLSAKARDFTEVFVISRTDFEMVSENYVQAIQAINVIVDGLQNDNYYPLKAECYICKAKDHLALKCNKFPRWRGNLMRLYMRKKDGVVPKKSSIFDMGQKSDIPNETHET